MRNRPVALCLTYMILFMLLVMVSCAIPMDKSSPITATPIPPTATPIPPTTTQVQEQYEYKQREKVCYIPSFTNENEKTEILSVSTEDGSFICMTTDEAQADAFINAQHYH